MTSENDVSRRRVLKGAGVATGVALTGSMSVVADPGNGGGNNPCEGCGALLTKYEWDDDQGKFVWEKGRDSLGIDGDEFGLTVTDWNEDGEPLGFEFDSIDNAKGDGIYEATCLTVKSGQGTESVDLKGWASDGSYHAPDKYAISNFALCINDAMWQADFGTGPPPTLNTEDPETREGYGGSSGRELIAAAVYGPPERVENFSYSEGVSGVTLVSTEFDLEDSKGNDVKVDSGDAASAAVTFDLDSEKELHFGTWEMPGPFDKGDIPWGPRYDMVHGTFAAGRHSLKVELPTL